MSQNDFFHPLTIIRKKRDKQSLSKADIQEFIKRYTAGEIPDYQMAALLMAIFLNGLNTDELLHLTNAMLHSGQVLSLDMLPGVKIDKHSTGGIGDKISLPLAAAVSVYGVYIPMISGRGLGITGGTLDKLESIPGFSSQLSIPKFIEVLSKAHMALIGQTADLAPADKKIYALRDASGTVECIPLIASSILSKKLAEGIDGLVLDVKCGRGALMQDLEGARKLAHALVGIAKGAGKKVTAYITAMDQPLGRWVGNAAEVNESLQAMMGQIEPDILQLTAELGAQMLYFAGKCPNLTEGQQLIHRALHDGSALKQFALCASLQGATVDLTAPHHWMQTNLHECIWELTASEQGYVSQVDAQLIGQAGIFLKIGRSKKEDSVDFKAAIFLNKKQGEFVNQHEVLCKIYAAADLPVDQLKEACRLVTLAYQIQSKPVEPQPLIIEVIK